MGDREMKPTLHRRVSVAHATREHSGTKRASRAKSGRKTLRIVLWAFGLARFFGPDSR